MVITSAAVRHPFPCSLAWVRMVKLIEVHCLSFTAEIHYFHRVIMAIMLLVRAVNIDQQQAPKMYLLLILRYHF